MSKKTTIILPDDYPEITQKNIDKSVYRKGLKKKNHIKGDVWAPMDKNIGKFPDDFMSDREQGNLETREALDEACEGKNLSRVYETPEELFDDLDKE